MLVDFGKAGLIDKARQQPDKVAHPAAQIVVVATRHDSHADDVLRALAAGKHVFVEKPLALRHDDLGRIEAACAAAPSSC